MTQPVAEQQPAMTPRSRQIVVALTLAVAIAAVTAYALFKSPNAVTVQVIAFNVHPTRADLTFDITKPYEAQATCVLRARDRTQAVVGRVTGYVVGPQADHHRRTRHTVTIPTSGPAVTAEVESCVITRDH